MKNVKDYNKSLNEGKINFNNSPFKKALPIKQVAELIKKASKEDVDKLLKTLTIKQVKDMESMKKGGGSDAGSLAAILTDEKGQPRVHWLKNRLSEYVNEETIGEYTPAGKNEFAGWVAFYNRNRIEIDKSEAKDISQAKQIAIKRLKVPKSKVGLLAIAPGYNESMHEKIEMNNLDWGKTTAERNKNLDYYDSLKTDKEKEEFLKKLKGMNEGEITDYVTALGTVVAQVMADHPKLGKYHEMKGKRGFIKLQQLKDLPEKELIALANSL